ncbi:MAG: Ig-like domain-containing protein, partial [Actinomycetota bacterium]
MRAPAKRRRLPLFIALIAIAGLLPQVAHAAIIIVPCTGLPTDIDDVQNAVDGAANGDTIRITGICDFALAAPHDGDATTNPATAVLVRPGAPISDLTIESGASEATIIGNGLNTAFMVGPGNNSITIRNLTFVNVARAVVAINTRDTVVGNLGATPDPQGIRVIGGPLTDSMILGIANDRGASGAVGTIPVDYGILGGSSFTYLGQAAGSLVSFQALGNYLTFVPPTLDAFTSDIVGIDVRQTNNRPVDGVSVRRNVVSMENAQFPLSHVNGIRVDGLSPKLAPLTGTVADYFIREVFIDDNILGRLVEVPIPPVNDLQFAGKTGISLTNVGDFLIESNEVRTIHAVSVLWDAGGGIVVSDSAFGLIDGNEINTVALPIGVPEGETTDFGAIGVMDEVASLYGDPIKPQTTHDITVTNNLIGVFPPFPVGIAQRGVVVAKADNINVTFNTSGFTIIEALHIAPLLDGPAATLAPVTVNNSTFCNNNWDGTIDDPNEVDFAAGPGGGASAGNSFPGGLPPNNSSCLGGGPGPTLVFIPTDNTQPLVNEAGPTSDCESFHLSQRPTSNVTITMTTDAQTTPLTVTRVFTPANWNVYQWMCATAVDDLVVEGTHISIVTYSAASADPVWAAMVPVPRPWIVIDNDFGLVNVIFLPGNACPGGVPTGESGPHATYQVVLTMMPPTDVVIRVDADQQLLVNDQSQLHLRFTPLNWNIPQLVRVSAVDDVIREGTPHFGFVTHTSFSDTQMWNNVAIPKLMSCITDNDGPGAPGVFAPAPNQCLNDGMVTLTGTGENGATVEIFENGVSLGVTAPIVAGIWVFGPMAYAEGIHALRLRQTGADGIPGAFYGAITFRVDTVAPIAPTITSPLPGAIFMTSVVPVSGTAEPNTRVIIRRNGIPVGSAITSPSGLWNVTLNLAAGAITLDAIAVDCAGNLSPPSAGVPITVVNPAPPIIVTPLEGSIQPSSVLVTGTGPAGCTVSVIENAIVLRAGIRVSGAGNWSVRLAFSAGLHTITATAQCGTISSAPSLPRSFNVDDSPPGVTLDLPPLGIIAEVGNPVTGQETTGEASDNLGVAAIMVTYTDMFSGSVV